MKPKEPPQGAQGAAAAAAPAASVPGVNQLMNFAEKLNLVGSQQKVDETASWNWQQLVEKLRGTGDPRLLTHYCVRLTKIERPPPDASQEVMGTVAICMLAYVEDAELVIAACNLWSHLCEGYDRNAGARKHGIASVGAIEAIIDGMKHHDKNRDVLLAGMRALSNACRGWNEYADWQKQQASDFGAFDVCLPAIRAFVTDTTVLHVALMAIVNVASGSGSSATRRKRRAISSNAINTVAEVLDLNMANASVAHDCIVALGTLYSIEHANLEVRKPSGPNPPPPKPTAAPTRSRGTAAGATRPRNTRCTVHTSAPSPSLPRPLFPGRTRHTPPRGRPRGKSWAKSSAWRTLTNTRWR